MPSKTEPMERIRQIELIGSWGARDVETGMTVDFNKAYKQDPNRTKGAESPLCRKLLRAGLAKEDDLVHVTQDGRNVWKNDLSVKWWADRDCIESRNRSVHWVMYQPMPEELKARVRSR